MLVERLVIFAGEVLVSSTDSDINVSLLPRHRRYTALLMLPREGYPLPMIVVSVFLRVAL